MTKSVRQELEALVSILAPHVKRNTTLCPNEIRELSQRIARAAAKLKGLEDG